MSISRLYSSPLQSTSKLTIPSTTLPSKKSPSTNSTTSTTILPGLISSLKPIKKLLPQLIEESSLLRRFCYKNKNQHKSNGWWKKIIEVDRNFERLNKELEGFLFEFGIKVGIEEAGRIGSEELLAGLIRLPRSLIIVEKSISVLLKAASVLEQLIHSKAFMSFAVVVVALISRLYTLSTVLLEELNRTKIVLLRLIETNPLLPKFKSLLRNLPPLLKTYLKPENDNQIKLNSTPFSSTTSSYANSPTSNQLLNDSTEEVGRAISRPSPLGSSSKLKEVEEVEIVEIPILVDEPVEVEIEEPVVKKRKKYRVVDEELSNSGGLIEKRKKVKKVKGGNDKDEIDDIFG